tara:strand:- start:3898 stop:4101 length:204 start_codon:yes stop_codon:yes gene_type:complete
MKLEDIEWRIEKGKPYAYHAYCYYKPKDMTIVQVSDTSLSDAKGYCIKELQWRLKHWDDYKKSTMQD